MPTLQAHRFTACPPHGTCLLCSGNLGQERQGRGDGCRFVLPAIFLLSALCSLPRSHSINHDPSRVPADLPEAQCLCLGCVNPFTMQEDRSMVSVPVFSQVPVRRRLCPPPPRPGPCRQRAVMETIAVGCMCNCWYGGPTISYT